VTKTLQLAEFLPFRLSVLSNMTSQAIASIYATRFAMSIPEWRVVAVLAETPGLSAAEVATRTAMDKVAVSRAVSALLASRRVVRKLALKDRRRSMLQLSAAGRELYRDVVPLARRYEAELLAGLTASESRELDTLLRKLLGRAAELGPAHTL
jgi:DNA-binding MarR family transcriptional regulator